MLLFGSNCNSSTVVVYIKRTFVDVVNGFIVTFVGVGAVGSEGGLSLLQVAEERTDDPHVRRSSRRTALRCRWMLWYTTACPMRPSRWPTSKTLTTRRACWHRPPWGTPWACGHCMRSLATEIQFPAPCRLHWTRRQMLGASRWNVSKCEFLCSSFQTSLVV